MSKIFFHTNTLCHRGTTTAILDYAKYNQELLGNESVIVYPLNFNDPGVSKDSLTQNDVVDKIKQQFNVYGYSSTDDLLQFVENETPDYFYSLKAGFYDWIINRPGMKNLVHAVFMANQPHGDKYAYVSSWLSEVMSDNKLPYVPHIVTLPKERQINWREKLNITPDKIVIGRYGGLHQFDIREVQQTVIHFAKQYSNYEFLFVNTFEFCDLPNVRFLPAIIDPQDKTDFILSCDAMIHARSDGESFGLAICEGLFHNKPVFCFNGGRDQHHIKLLKDTGLLYSTIPEFVNQLLNVKNSYKTNYSKLVESFSPENVMKQFNDIFLS